MPHHKAKSNVLTSKTAINRLAIKTGECSGLHVTVNEAVERLKTACSDHRVAKSIADKLRKEFQNEYKERRSKDYKVSPEVMKKMIHREEYSRTRKNFKGHS